MGHKDNVRFKAFILGKKIMPFSSTWKQDQTTNADHRYKRKPKQ